ncbi:MAG: transcriptional repressor [Candidatus Cloacimonetes bacterium]|nr:transcriptional repressor [Candidatus Cloacimonadota bacterium]
MEKYLEILKQKKLKKTPKRLEILRIMQQSNSYFSPLELRDLLKEKFNKVGLPTVYRILQQFQEIGIASSIQKEDNQLYYFLCSSQHDHHHFICRKCHKVSCVEYCNFDAIKQLVEDQLKSKAESHILQIEGLCRDCKES